MTLTEFVNKYNGKYLDFDGAFGSQCYDLFHQYCVEVLGLNDPKIMASPAAKDLYNNFDNLYGHEHFERIPNTPDSVPNEGDIMVWGFGTWGHVGVFVEGDVNSFRSYEQNYPLNSPCHIQNHTTYNSVLGWLRFNKDVPISPELAECRTKLLEEEKKKQDNWQWGMEMQTELEGVKAEVITHENNLKAIASTLKTEPEMPKILNQITKFVTIEDQLREAVKKNTQQASELTVMTQKVSELEQTVDNTGKTNKQQEIMLLDKDKELKEVSDKLAELTKELETMEMPYKPLFKILKTKYWIVEEIKGV